MLRFFNKIKKNILNGTVIRIKILKNFSCFNILKYKLHFIFKICQKITSRLLSAVTLMPVRVRKLDALSLNLEELKKGKWKNFVKSA